MNKQGRILVVDDLKNWRDELVETLQRGGFHADSASTATQALERLNETFYHLLVLDIRMVEKDPSNIEGITLLLHELDKRGLSEATKVIMLSAHGTPEHMRTSFRVFKVVDFLDKNDFNNHVFLDTVRHMFAEKVNINLELGIYWQQGSKEQFVLNLDVDGIRVSHGTPLQTQVAAELEDLLSRLFHEATSVLVRPLTPGRSGTGVLRVRPFYQDTGGSNEVVVKIGDARKVDDEYWNFKQYVQPFIGGGRSTTVLSLRRTAHLGGIIYSLLGSNNNQLMDLGVFYRHVDISQIIDALDRLFRNTCGAWYANHGHLLPHNLTADYQRLFDYTPERLEQVVFEELKTVQGKQHISFKNLKGERSFTNPLQVTAGLTLVRPTYVCTTHGDFNQHNLLVDNSGNMWLINFQSTGQGHILRDIAMLDSTVRFQLLEAKEATLEERLQMEKALCTIEYFSEVEQLATSFSTENQPLTKAYTTIVHLRKLAGRLVEQNPNDDMSEYYIALLYNALNHLRFSALSSIQREHALLCASLLADQLGLGR